MYKKGEKYWCFRECMGFKKALKRHFCFLYKFVTMMKMQSKSFKFKNNAPSAIPKF